MKLVTLQDAISMAELPKYVLTIPYTNHRGERRMRKVVPMEVTFEKTPYHPEQWILRVYDVEKKAPRSFTMLGFGSLEPATPFDKGIAAMRDAEKDVPVTVIETSDGPALSVADTVVCGPLFGGKTVMAWLVNLKRLLEALGVE
jgi:hypothetical protein